MDAAGQGLKWATAAAFVLLGLITLLDWLRRGDRKRLYMAAAVGLLGLVSVVSNVMALPDVAAGLKQQPIALRAITAVDVVVLVLSGYALLRFRDALVPYAGWMRRALNLATAAALVLGVAVPLPSNQGARLNALQVVTLLFIIVFWMLCIAEPAVRLFLRARKLPVVQRARMRAFSAGYGLIVLIIVAAVGAGSAGRSPAFQLVTQAVGLLIAPFLYLSFTPPAWVRRSWRAKEEAVLASRNRELMSSANAEELAATSVEWAARLVGADGAAIVDGDGRLLASHGIDPEVVRQVRSGTYLQHEGEAMIHIPLQLESGEGSLVLRAGPITPLFGADELVQLEVHATLLSVALDRCRLLAALRDSEARAQDANHAKSKFLASMSHELRTPMGAIIGFADVLAEGVDGDLNEEQRLDVERIQTAARHLLALLDDVLDISKIEAGRLELFLTSVELDALAADIIATLTPVAAAKSLEMRASGLEGITVHADSQRVRQVLLNLITNAIKFTDSGGVYVEGRRNGNMVRIAVRDTGVGIPEDARNLVFEEFRQVESGVRRSKGGTGLGLAICKRLVELHGGRIGCDSAPGEGSTFWFTLPWESPEVAAGEHANGAAQPAAGATTPAVPWAGSTDEVILVVDDDADARSLIAKRLHEGGYRTVEATDGRQGLELARSLTPMAITLDLRMPVTGGAEVLQLLADDKRTRDIPVVLVTITDRSHIAVSADRVLYVQKPFTKDELLAAIDAAVHELPTYDVMVIDDDPTVADLISKSLAPSSAVVRHAESGPEALEGVRAKTPDVILLDLLMPEMSGFEVLSRLRANDSTRHVPVIVVSAKDLTFEDMRLLDAQIDRLVRKSDLSSSNLAATIRQLVGRQHVAV